MSRWLVRLWFDCTIYNLCCTVVFINSPLKKCLAYLSPGHWLSVCLSVCHCLCLRVSTYPSVGLSCLYVYLSINLCVWLSVCVVSNCLPSSQLPLPWNLAAIRFIYSDLPTVKTKCFLLGLAPRNTLLCSHTRANMLVVHIFSHTRANMLVVQLFPTSACRTTLPWL